MGDLPKYEKKKWEENQGLFNRTDKNKGFESRSEIGWY